MEREDPKCAGRLESELTYRKKLIEVALPLEAINVASAREKSIRHGHPSTLHLWWARRPLAACRAVLFASLVDDPDSDPAYAHYDAETREHMAGEKRQQLFDLITELVQWENSNNELIINAARAEIARCVASRKIELGELAKDHELPGGETVYDLVVKGHGDLPKLRSGLARLPSSESVNTFLAEYAPPVLDPFAGGGSIPLEAQRLGLKAYASDLNPVPVLINKALIEIPPKFANKPPVNPESRGEAGPAGKKGKGKGKSVTGQSEWRGVQGLADDVRYYGKWMRDEAEKRIGRLYPKVKVTAETAKDRPDLKPYLGEELTVIAWLWARTVASPNPACKGKHIPLVKSFWLSKKADKKVWLEPIVSQATNGYTLRITTSDTTPPAGTVNRKGAICLLTGSPISFDYIRSEGKSRRLGRMLLAVVAEGKQGRIYLPPSKDHERIAESAVPTWIPEAELAYNPFALRPPLYGFNRFADLFTSRQLLALDTLSELIRDVHARILIDAAQPSLGSKGKAAEASGAGMSPYADAICTYLAFLIDKLADLGNALNRWEPVAQCPRQLFSRQAIPMIWDFAEGNPFSSSSGSWDILLRNTQSSLESPLMPVAASCLGSVTQADAVANQGSIATKMICTDPPYYNNIDYADLSDFFYIWLRRSIAFIYPSLFSVLLTPKAQELVATPYRHEGNKDAAKQFFELGLGRAFLAMRYAQAIDFPSTVFYAFKQTEDMDESEEDEEENEGSVASTGWETMLEGLIDAGFLIHGTWPIRTEMRSRMMGMNMNALASSIILTCRPRPSDAPLATRREFLNALRRELPDSLRRLQQGSIAPVDLAQASIGPGMAVFTRYTKVVEADGSRMKVRQALSLINQSLDEVLAEQEGEFDGDTRWAVAWFEQFGMEEGAFGVAETLSKAKNTAVNALVDAGLIAARAGKVRLLTRGELPADWNPATDNKVRHWEVAQHLIRTLETGGETAAADLLRKVGGMGEVARDLAYRLYNLCERKKWASEALAYNGLVIAWPEISKLAQQPVHSTATQAEMFPSGGRT